MSTHIDKMLPGELGLEDDIAARLDGIGCLALRLDKVRDSAARMIILEAMMNATLSIAPKVEVEDKQGFNRFRVVQAEQGH